MTELVKRGKALVELERGLQATGLVEIVREDDGSLTVILHDPQVVYANTAEESSEIWIPFRHVTKVMWL